MCICKCIYIYIYIRTVYTHLCIHVYTYYIHIYTYIQVYIAICTCMWTDVFGVGSARAANLYEMKEGLHPSIVDVRQRFLRALVN